MSEAEWAPWLSYVTSSTPPVSISYLSHTHLLISNCAIDLNYINLLIYMQACAN